MKKDTENLNNKMASHNTKNGVNSQVEHIKSLIALREEETLAWWQKNHIFEQSVERDAPLGEFIFYDGPPFATGLPHYGHLLAGTIKDIIPRYKTMRGFRVRRRWGWDCHGLPIENLIEKELGFKTKEDIEIYGIERFNSAARDSVLRYDQEWKRIVPRSGRFVDMKHAYKSMDWKYTESVWWAFQTLYKKGYITQGYKPMHLCPRCETTLANFEVNQGYTDVKDLSATVSYIMKDDPTLALLVWTTTPWTLPGNVAIAVNSYVDYVTVKIEGHELMYVIAHELVERVCVGLSYEIISHVKGNELVGRAYEPIFSYFENVDLVNKKNAWKIYPAEFVTTEEGTGLVHIAPAFGTDDHELAEQFSLPRIHHIQKDGRFVSEVTDFAGMLVKQKDDTMSADIEIVKWLAHNKRLFSKEKITHSYPLCWRCDTPLINFATTSWFVDVPSFRDKLIAHNAQTKWIPSHIRDGRFGKWIEGAKEWAISRSRFWGAPLPVWKDEKGEVFVIGSREELAQYTKPARNSYVGMRHGQAESNVTKTLSTIVSNVDPLTEVGREQLKEALVEVKKFGITKIVASPFQRTRETATYISEQLSIPLEYDDRLREISVGDRYEGQHIGEYHAQFRDPMHRWTCEGLGGCETLNDVKKRAMATLMDLEQRFENETILIVSHGTPLWMLFCGTAGYNEEECISVMGNTFKSFENAEVRELPYLPFPHNEQYEFDMHRPYIDTLELVSDTGEPLTRIEDVFDVWFDSACMPYAQVHYPFEHKQDFLEKCFPAQYIAEGLDQTRGWFYLLLVLGVALFDRSSYENVIVNGIVLAEDGKKMSKRFNNYPPVEEVFDGYGADAMRFFLINSPAVRGEEVSLSSKALQDVASKVIGRWSNILILWEQSNGREYSSLTTSENVLDRWILELCRMTHAEVTDALEKYELDRGARAIAELIEDFSTWYVRRSRDRYKDADPRDALGTTRYILSMLAKISAPYIPFISEYVYQAVRDELEPISVHLSVWPELISHVDPVIIEDMKVTRDVVTCSLDARTQAGIRVRQPLAKLTIGSKLNQEFLELIKDEVNVKEIYIDTSLHDTVLLDIQLTEELISEGYARELTRSIQSLRKSMGLVPDQRVILSLSENAQSFFEIYKNEIFATANISRHILGQTSPDVTDSKEMTDVHTLKNHKEVINSQKAQVGVEIGDRTVVIGLELDQ